VVDLIDRDLVQRLREVGCVAADEEAAALLAQTDDPGALSSAVARRAAGEPLAWILGRTTFGGLDVRVAPGVYVPRWQTEWVARAASSALPDGGTALDMCCGSGAIAMLLAADHPRAHVIGVDIDPDAVRCAYANGIDAREGDLFDAVPSELRSGFDVIVAVCPYVPTVGGAIASTAEPAGALFGGADGLAVVDRVIGRSPAWLAPGGALIVELGAPQFDPCRRRMQAAGFAGVEPIIDGDGDVTGIAARYPVGG
jgi:release factor glutamine methyltransferase